MEPDTQTPAVQAPEDVAEVDNDFGLHALAPEERLRRREAKRPTVDHLEAGVADVDGNLVALFDVGSRVIVERRTSIGQGSPWWLDTKQYTVNGIDDDTGKVLLFDDDLLHHGVANFKNPNHIFKLCPLKGNPFRVQRTKQADDKPVQAVADGAKKHKGRPKGSKNRPKDIIAAEKKARREARQK